LLSRRGLKKYGNRKKRKRERDRIVKHLRKKRRRFGRGKESGNVLHVMAMEAVAAVSLFYL
jgi:hypothetical protein